MPEDPESSNASAEQSGEAEQNPLEIDWHPPENVEERELFDKLVEDIKAMYEFARERGIPVPDKIIDGIAALLPVTGTHEKAYQDDILAEKDA